MSSVSDDHMTSLSTYVQEMRELGVHGTTFRVWWEFKVRSGFATHLERWTSRRESEITATGSVTLDETALRLGYSKEVADTIRARIPKEAHALLLSRAMDAERGGIVCFGRWCANYGIPIDWHLNPLTGRRWRKDVHWTAALDGADQSGDVKLTWEISRFPHAYLMGRAASLYPAYAPDLLDGLLRQLESFEQEAPFGFGVHWYSGQEIAIRALALVFAYYAFGHPDRLAGYVVRALYRAGLYIESHIEYAREAVFNNHLIWEALGLYMAGRMLNGLPEAPGWESAGRQILDQQAKRQVYADGGYIQQSHTYHRMAMQAYLVASRLAGDLPTVWRAAMERSLDFLTAQQNPQSGQLPNYGANDGTLPCILSTCDYTDFRPTLQALSLLVRDQRQYEPGPWDEEAAWLLGPTLLDSPVHRQAFVSRSFGHTGFHVLRGKTGDSFSVFRCGSLRDRFSQIDMLHLDVWWRGHNVLADPGSYLYNGPERWHNHFLRTESHNTVQLDGYDQMLHYRKFKCLYWTSAKLLLFEDNADWALCEGEHYGYQRHPGRCVHRRSVLYLKDDLWIVVDRIEGVGTHRVRLHWLGGDFPYRPGLDGQTSLQLETPDGLFHVGVFNAAGRPLSGEIIAGQDDPPRGWLSRYYGEKVPVPSLVVDQSVRLPLTLVSILGPHVPSVSVSASSWSVMAGDRTIEFELSADGAVVQPHLLTPASVIA